MKTNTNRKIRKKTKKIGDLTFRKLTTQIKATESVLKALKKEKISPSLLIPQAYIWYESELLEIIDENGDSKPDNCFGKNFQIIYFLPEENSQAFEQQTLFQNKTTIKNIKLKYITLKTTKPHKTKNQQLKKHQQS